MSQKFTEAQLETVFAELISDEGYPHHLGDTLNRLDDEVMKPVSPKSEVHSFAGVDGDSRIERPKRLRQDTFTLQQRRLCAPFASRLPCSPISWPSSRCSFSALPRGPRPHRRCA